LRHHHHLHLLLARKIHNNNNNPASPKKSFLHNDIVFFFVKEGSSNFLSNAKSLEKNLYTSWKDGQVGYVVMWVQKSPQNNIFFILPP
jgi:hypothetical protein